MLIKLNKRTCPHFDNIRFVVRAAANPGDRYSLHLIKVEDGYAEATQGHVIHGAEVGDDLKDGYYEKIRLTKYHIVLHRCDDQNTMDMYPKLYHVYPEHKNPKRINFGCSDFDSALTSFHRYYREDGLTVKYKYLEPILRAMNKIKVFHYSGNRAIVFWDDFSNDKWAVVMPMRMSD